MASASEPVISSTIKPRAKDANQAPKPQPARADPPRPIRFVVVPMSRDRQIQNALKTQECCCCDLQIGLTIGFCIIFLLSASSYNWLSIIQFLCAIIGLIGVWVGSRTYLTVAKFALYFNIGVCIAQLIFCIVGAFAMTHIQDQFAGAGMSIFRYHYFGHAVLVFIALSQCIGILLQFVMISYINTAICDGKGASATW